MAHNDYPIPQKSNFLQSYGTSVCKLLPIIHIPCKNSNYFADYSHQRAIFFFPPFHEHSILALSRPFHEDSILVLSRSFHEDSILVLSRPLFLLTSNIRIACQSSVAMTFPCSCVRWAFLAMGTAARMMEVAIMRKSGRTF